MHPKDLVTHFQEMAFFIMQWRSVSEILGFEVEEFCEVSATSLSFLIF